MQAGGFRICLEEQDEEHKRRRGTSLGEQSPLSHPEKVGRARTESLGSDEQGREEAVVGA